MSLVCDESSPKYIRSYNEDENIPLLNSIKM